MLQFFFFFPPLAEPHGLQDFNSLCLDTQLCLTLQPNELKPAKAPLSGILQARILEWVAISFSRESSQPRIKPRSPTLLVDSLPSELPGNLFYFIF